MPKKKQKPPLPGFERVPNTAGKIIDCIWIKEDNSELFIKFAWGDHLHFKPMEQQF